MAGYRNRQGIPSCGRKRRNELVKTKTLKVASWNVRTLLDNNPNLLRRRTALIAAELACYDIDIAALSETRLPGAGSLTEVGEGYTFFWQGLPSEQHRIHGVGFAVRTSLLSSIPSTPEGINERLITWRIPLAKSQHATLLSAYAPTLPSEEQAKDTFYNCLHEALQRIPPTDKIVLMGDMNTTHGQNSTHGRHERENWFTTPSKGRGTWSSRSR